MSATQTARTMWKACRKESSASRVHFYDLKNLATKKHNSQQCGDELIKSDEKRRHNFQFGGKDELPHILRPFFSEILEVLNPGIKSVKNIWNLKRV